MELLSISSGDEEDSSKASNGGRGRGRASGRKEEGDSRDWDGVEADCWKRVDEAEVFTLSSSLLCCDLNGVLFAWGFGVV